MLANYVRDTDRRSNNVPQLKRVGECLYRNTCNGMYSALVKRRGKQFRKSLKTDDRLLAERRLSDYRNKIGLSVNSTKDRKTTFWELAQDWFAVVKTRYKASSVRGAEVCIRGLNKHFGLLSVRSITAEDCRRWEKKHGAEWSASNFNHYRTFLVAVLNYAVREGLILENPALAIPRRKLPKSKVVCPSREQFFTVVNGIRKLGYRANRGADLVELLGFSGMRLAEATSLTWGDVDFDRQQFTVTGGTNGPKNHEARAVPLFPNFRILLERLKTGKAINHTERVISIGTAKKAISHACKNAGLPHFYHHLFRHFFASQAIEQNIDFKTIANWLGHKDGGILVAKTYGHLRDEHSTDMAKRMTFGIPAPTPTQITQEQPRV